MFSILKMIIWIAGIIVVGGFVLNYFGYEINMNYFKESKAACEQRLNACGKDLVANGTSNAKCDFNCVDPKVIIKKK